MKSSFIQNSHERKIKCILDEVINDGNKCLPVKNNSLVWDFFPKNLDFDIAFTVNILREKKFVN